LRPIKIKTLKIEQMSTQKPGIPSGTRDFSPIEMVKRNYIFETVKQIFQRYGYLPIETPAMENLSTLLGKYGEEGDKLLFKVLNSGDYLNKIEESELLKKNSTALATKISEKGLRYDLTVPFARFVVQYRNDISFPFKRYQIQPVWRADKPQKGRYREFYQCDVDVVGSNSLLNEVELTKIIDDVFTKLNINVIIKINNRKVLSGIAEIIGEAEKITDITVAIDKLEKIGKQKVNEELALKGISAKAIEKLQPIFDLTGTNKEKLVHLAAILAQSEVGRKGVEELEYLFNYFEQISYKAEIELDLTLARGLNYYTGAIFEVKAKDVQIGSICGGGRYDNLTGIFGLPGVSGVGVSFGADRIYDVMTQLELFPSDNLSTTKVMFVNFGEKEVLYSLPIINQLRQNCINSELYPDNTKMKKQFDYANKKNIPYVIVTGENEIAENIVLLKDMKTGEQQKLLTNDLIEYLKNH
jgi:histidyl-tRNA synthetase